MAALYYHSNPSSLLWSHHLVSHYPCQWARHEGGFKVWECSVDLCSFLLSRVGRSALIGRRVLELGCGAGIPGVAALKLGALVDFQDFVSVWMGDGKKKKEKKERKRKVKKKGKKYRD